MSDAALVKKLRLEKYPHRLLVQAFGPVVELEGLEFDVKPGPDAYDLVLAFVLNLEDMATIVHRTAGQVWLRDDGLLYLCYPKKGNPIHQTFIGRDDIFPYLKVDRETGLVPGTHLKFNSMAAFNDVYTVIGLKKLREKDYQKLTNP